MPRCYSHDFKWSSRYGSSTEDLVITLKNAIAHNDLIKENKKLAVTVRSQHKEINRQLAELKRLEKESPGITQVDRGDDGSIDLGDEF